MPQQVINGVGRVRVRKASSSQPSSYDTDAQAFITATAITDTTQKNAINDLVLDLKAAGVWTKMRALYPMVGGTATTHKFNLKDPRDLDAAYRLTFAGGGTHGPNGYQLNGTTAYANTNLIPSTSGLGQNSTHLSFYSRTNNTSLYDFGHVWTSQTSLIYLQSRATDGKVYYRLNSQNAAGTESSHTIADSLGLFTVNRNSASSQDLFKNSTKFSSNFNSYGTVSTNILLGALYVNGSYYYGARQCAFSSIGDGLTDLESNLFYQIVEKFQYALGRNVNANQTFYFNRNYSNETNAFIFNGAISDATQQSAINTLVNDLKAAGIWTKMKALYPMVGGTATAHKFNLVNPVDTNAAYRLTFSGGWTHSSTGALPNGSNAYANTFFTPSVSLTVNSTHLSYYSRTNSISTGLIGSQLSGGSNAIQLAMGSTFIGGRINDNTYNEPAVTNTRAFIMLNRNSSTSKQFWRNNTIYQYTVTSTGLPNQNILLGAYNNNGGITNYDNRETGFSSIGDGLTDLESTLFYQIVEKFQYTLGRNINATQPFYYNSAYTNETNAFIFNGAISDATQISAVNTLVTTLKTAGVWTKMKAVYPMVGGTALAHKFNLVNPVDSTSAYALTFAGGWTHSSTGALPNGTTAYANTNLTQSTSGLAQNNWGFSVYSRTNKTGNSGVSFGSEQAGGVTVMYLKTATNNLASYMNSFNIYFVPNTDSRGFFQSIRNTSTSVKLIKNSTINNGSITSSVNHTIPFYLAANNYYGTATGFDNCETAFASIGDGLTDAEATTFYNAVQAFQTTLGRQV
jgi:hypothetical protein